MTCRASVHISLNVLIIPNVVNSNTYTVLEIILNEYLHVSPSSAGIILRNELQPCEESCSVVKLDHILNVSTIRVDYNQIPVTYKSWLRC